MSSIHIVESSDDDEPTAVAFHEEADDAEVIVLSDDEPVSRPIQFHPAYQKPPTDVRTDEDVLIIAQSPSYRQIGSPQSFPPDMQINQTITTHIDTPRQPLGQSFSQSLAQSDQSLPEPNTPRLGPPQSSYDRSAPSTPILATIKPVPISTPIQSITIQPFAAPPSATQKVSPYAVSLLSSGAIFRSYSLSLLNNTIEFQDIKLYALFPPAVEAPTLCWGPPQQRTAQLAKRSLPILSINEIFRGKKSLLFRSASPLVSIVSSSRCFTLHSPTVSLHLEAMTQQLRDEWISRLVEIARVFGHRKLVYTSANEDETEEAARRVAESQRHFEAMRASSLAVLTRATTPQPSPQRHDSERSISSKSGASRDDSSFSLTGSMPSFSFRGMRVVTAEKQAREKLELQADMQYTLRTCVAASAAWIQDYGDSEKASSEEFTHVDKATTTHLPTPDHPSPNFEYKAYAGPIFSRLRWMYGVKDEDYLQSVASHHGYNDFIANSKSGSFFFYTYDKRYLIKSMTFEEASFLRDTVLPSYYHHLSVYRDSLLSKIFGLYRINRPHSSNKIYFMLMVNVFYSERPIHLRFDLKGSTLGRRATDQEKQQETPVLKDLDFIDGTQLKDQKLPPTYLKLGLKKRAVVSQLTIDAHYLQQLEIMDYSLLVGVHYRDRAAREAEIARRSEMSARRSRVSERQQNYGTRKDEIVIPRVVMKQVQRKMIDQEKERRASIRGAADTSVQDIRINIHDAAGLAVEQPGSARNMRPDPSTSDESQTDGEENDDESPNPAHTTPTVVAADPPPTPSVIRVSSSLVFTEVDGGLCSVDPVTGKAGNEIYYLGVIDILQRYTARKKVEHNMKSLTHDSAAVSCAPPAFYAQRFLNMITSRMLGAAEDGSAWQAIGAPYEEIQPDEDDSMTVEEFIHRSLNQAD